MKIKPVMLMILDGWGVAKPSPVNAASVADTPNLDGLLSSSPHTFLTASGEAVGLPEGQMGNSEVGHLNIGAGRIVYQELTKITKHIREKSFFRNEVLLKTMEKVRQENSSLHLLGLLSDGGVHSHLQHLFALLAMAKEQGISRVFVHAFLDGRDVPPQSALTYVEQLEAEMQRLGLGKIAVVSGRYYAMDRDKRWERVEKAYNAMTRHEGKEFSSAAEGIKASYAEGVNDEFVLPFIVSSAEDSRVHKGDGMIFFNFRPDRARQITRAFVDKEFPYFQRNPEAFPVHFACMTQYDATIEAPVIYPPEDITNTLGEVVAAAGLKQLRIAETEKYAHVTFFFNGGKEVPNVGEERVLIPSPKVATYDLQPEMSAPQVTEQLLKLLDEDKFDLIILNFANPDMVGHTGVMDAAVRAMEAVDKCVGAIVNKVRAKGGVVCITADHGNLEQMVDPVTGAPHTAHTTNRVNFIVVGDPRGRKLHEGVLADIAPTLLQLLELPQPAEMTGKSLFN